MNLGSQQLHFRYSPEDDRIMAFVRREGGKEHVFELTRRVIKALWPQLASRVSASSEAVKKAPTDVRKKVLEFEQEGAMQSAKQTGAVSTNQKLPEVQQRTRYLVKKIQLQDHPSGRKILHFSDGKTSLNLPITVERLQVICELLRSLATNADWDLSLAYGMAPTKPGQKNRRPVATRRPRESPRSTNSLICGGNVSCETV